MLNGPIIECNLNTGLKVPKIPDFFQYSDVLVA